MLFWLAIMLLIMIFLMNWMTGSKGTFVDHTNMMWDLVGKKGPTQDTPQTSEKKSFESKGERECRRVIEKLTGQPFPKERPSFLLNGISGQNLELDCFNQDLKLAVEYNGEQHYKFIPFFHETKDAFYNIRYRDEMKKRLCDENGVTLIVVPFTIHHEDIEDYITKELKNAGLLT